MGSVDEEEEGKSRHCVAAESRRRVEFGSDSTAVPASICNPGEANRVNLDLEVFYRTLFSMHLLAREEAGLRCLLRVALAEVHGGADPVPIPRIAVDEGLSDVYVAKLMRQLRLSGVVESTRGAAGGYRLARAASLISVWDAMRALDPSFLPGEACDCQPADRVDCRRTTSCAVNSLWRRLGDEIRASLEAVSLADLCQGALDPASTVTLPLTTSFSSPTPSPTSSPTPSPTPARYAPIGERSAC